MSHTQLDELIDYKSAVVINFRGGESLLAKNCFYVLEKLLETGNTRCNLQFTTNGSVPVTDRQKQIFMSFKNISFGVSIDGEGKVFEYMRYPLEWKKVQENIQQLKQITNNVSICPTISNINLIYFSDLINWCVANGFNYNYNLVECPSYFNPSALPIKIKRHILENSSTHTSVKSILEKTHTIEDEENFKIALNEIQRQDSLKKIRIQDYMIEFCKLANI